MSQKKKHTAARRSGMGSPSFRHRNPLTLTEVAPTEAQRLGFLRDGNTYLRVYRLGECSVIVTREGGSWHLSVGHKTRYPHWDEIAEARYRVVPDDVVMVMPLPPSREYININPNVFQLFEVDPAFMGGGVQAPNDTHVTA